VDKVQITDGGVHERLERRGSDALDDPGPQQTGVVLARRAGPGAAEDQDDGPDDKGVALAPEAARGHEEGAGEAHAEQEVARQQGDAREVDLEPQGERYGVGGQDGAERGREDGREGEDEGDEVALP